MRLLLTHLITAMWLAAGPQATAQDTAAETAQGEDPKPPAIDARANSQNENSEPAQEPETQDDSSPFDYKSSEEISEDLSVSFPVDI